jgi:hypothetical protein
MRKNGGEGNCKGNLRSEVKGGKEDQHKTYCLIVEEQATKCVTKKHVRIAFVTIWSTIDDG